MARADKAAERSAIALVPGKLGGEGGGEGGKGGEGGGGGNSKQTGDRRDAGLPFDAVFQ